MSVKRHNKRKQLRMAGGHLNVLTSHLSLFYEFLEAEIKPSDQEVRETFLKHKEAWYKYCDSNKLKDSAKDLFVMNVEKRWKHKSSKETTL